MMKNFSLLVCFVWFLGLGAFSQDRIISKDGQQYRIHTVEKGETIFSLAKRFGLEQKELVNANPDLLFGLKTGQELKIPVSANAPKAQQQDTEVYPVKTFHYYRVKKNNTLHFISKKYDVSVQDIEMFNPEVTDGLKKGMVLRIPDSFELNRLKEKLAEERKAEQEKVIIHKVVGDETLYSISKKYDRSIASIVKQNPELKEGLKIGMEIKIPAQDVGAGQEGVRVGSDGFFIHLVETGETFWRLERKYGTTQEELIEYNPVLEQGLMAGLRIRIPARNIPDVHAVVDENIYEKHLVQKGETLYGLAIEYNTRISKLKEANPVLDLRGLIAGEEINVPRQTEVQADKGEVAEPSEEKEFSERIETTKTERLTDFVPVASCPVDSLAALKTYQVALLLPLYLQANDTVNHIRITSEQLENDTLLRSQFEDILESGRDTFMVRKERIVYPRSENFIHFYEGVLLAVDSLQRAGMKVDLHVFDTNQEQQVVDSLLHLDLFRELDLIIGPIFPNLQSRIANFAFKNRIPMVSPLSSGGDFEQNNPYYFKVNPNKDYLIRKTAQYMTDEFFDKNIIVLEMGEYKHLQEATLVDLCREKFFSTGFNSRSGEVLFHEYDFKKEGYWGLSRIASRDRENVFIIPSENEGQISVGVTNLNALSEDYPVTLIGLSNFQRYQSIQPEYYHHVKMQLLSPYFVDYQSPITNWFIDGFRKNFSAEPNQFSFQGFDVAFYFMSALYRYGSDFRDCLEGHRINLTQGEFSFEKESRFGGYMNHGVFVVSYNRDYSITDKKRLISHSFSLAGQ